MRAPALRPAGLLVAGLLLLSAAPSASAEWGAYGPDGWPLAVDGTSTNPFPGTIAKPGAEPLNEILGTTVYPYYPILTAEVQRLALEHPDLVKVHSIGKSTLGLDIWMLEIADFANPDKIPLEQREVVWVDGGTHSNEYSGVYFVAHLASFLLDEYGTNDTAKWIVENRHTWLMPMVNPDGSNLFGRLNANLVNINRNYPVVWDGEGHDELMNNRGPHPASEIETQLNIEWFNKTQPDYYASVHCCGNLWLYPYGEEGVDPLDNTTLARVCQEAFPTVGDDCGPIWSTIYPASGSSVDTVYEYTGAVAFGYEMSGRGALALWGQPFTMDSVREQEFESWDGIMHAFLNVEKYGAYPVVRSYGGGPNSLTFTIQNDGYGPMSSGRIIVSDPDNNERTVDIPEIAPGGNATVRLPNPGDGLYEARMEFQKRYAAAPTESQPLYKLAIVEDGRGIHWRAASSSWEDLDNAADDLKGDFNEVPLFGAAAPILTMFGVAVAVARRGR